MSLAMDRALMALSLDEEDTPFEMPDLPGFTSAEENKLSLMGRLLNPERQRMSNLIIQMPRKWQKEGKVRGIALSQEKFQFIFNSEHDLQDVLDKGVQTHYEWVIVLERWKENPPEDYLQYIPLWVRISNIPETFYTVEAIGKLGDFVGKVELVAFDPSKPVTQNYIRVLVKFNVANPLRTSKALTYKGKSFVIHYNYENVQKRCFECFRLNHEKDYSPLVVRKRQEEAAERRSKVSPQSTPLQPFFKEGDPLKGVLADYQVGINPMNGRPKISKEVLEEMRRYLLADTGENREIKEYKIKQSVSLAEKDPVAQKLCLQLEAPPQVTKELNKGKGLVFDYSKKSETEQSGARREPAEKLMAASIKAHSSLILKRDNEVLLLRDKEESDGGYFSSRSDEPTGFSAGFYDSGSAGFVKKRSYQRKRPPKARRMQRKFTEKERGEILEGHRREGKQEVGCKKKKWEGEGERSRSISKAPCIKVIPNEGSPKL